MDDPLRSRRTIIGGQLYTHVTPLWFWLKLGPLGFRLPVVWATAIRTAYGVWRQGTGTGASGSPPALGAAFVGLMVAELTGPFTGIDVRITLTVAVAFGWLVAARAGLQDEGATRRPRRTTGGAATVDRPVDGDGPRPPSPPGGARRPPVGAVTKRGRSARAFRSPRPRPW